MFVFEVDFSLFFLVRKSNIARKIKQQPVKAVVLFNIIETILSGKARKFSLGFFEPGSLFKNRPNANFWAVELCSLKNLH